jgi:hypothetical protein
MFGKGEVVVVGQQELSVLFLLHRDDYFGSNVWELISIDGCS